MKALNCRGTAPFVAASAAAVNAAASGFRPTSAFSASFEFALASVAAALEVKDGKITAARLALGGVATKPWRATEAEKALVGAKPEETAYAAAARAALEGARPQKFNAFKIELAKRAVVRALTVVGGMP